MEQEEANLACCNGQKTHYTSTTRVCTYPTLFQSGVSHGPHPPPHSSTAPAEYIIHHHKSNLAVTEVANGKGDWQLHHFYSLIPRPQNEVGVTWVQD